MARAKTPPVQWPAPVHLDSLMPDLTAGLCQPGRSPLSPEAWTSLKPHVRNVAVRVCSQCPVLDACREWAVTLPAGHSGIVAGMNRKERNAARLAAA